jgi:hypothetical protein
MCRGWWKKEVEEERKSFKENANVIKYNVKGRLNAYTTNFLLYQSIIEKKLSFKWNFYFLFLILSIIHSFELHNKEETKQTEVATHQPWKHMRGKLFIMRT